MSTSVTVSASTYVVDPTTEPITVTVGTLAALWGNISGTLANQTDLQAALDAKAALNSPTFTGSPKAPTKTAGDNSTNIATTAYVDGAGFLTVTAGNAAYQPKSSTLTTLAGKTVPSGALVGTTDIQTLTNKTLTAPSIATITNGGTLTLPTSTDTLIARTTTDTLSNKTLVAPVVSSIVNGGQTVSFPASTDTLVARNTTDTLTNKTIDLGSNTLTATSEQLRTAVSDETGTGALVFADSPTLAGTPLAPTAVANTNTTQIATTAFVVGQGYIQGGITKKATDQAITSSTTLVDCTNLSFSAAASTSYVVELGLIVMTDGGDMDAQMVGPSGATFYGTWVKLNNTSPHYENTTTTVSTEETITQGLVGATSTVIQKFLVTTDVTAGTVKLQFAQNSSSANPSTIKAGSWIKYEKVG